MSYQRNNYLKIGLASLLQKQSSLFLLLIFLLSSILHAEAIVNIEDLRRDGEKGFFANISGSLSFSRGNRNRDSFSFQSSLDRNTDNLESFFVVQRARKQINSNNYDSSTLAHLRLNFLFKESTSLETFYQYSKNPFRMFNKRELFGIGARFISGSNLKAGIGLMNEKDEDLSSNTVYTLRMTSYLHNEYIIEENINFNISGFYQPSIESFSDYKATLIGQFDFFINENFKISLQYNTFYDSEPPTNAKKKEEGFATIFSYNFN